MRTSSPGDPNLKAKLFRGLADRSRLRILNELRGGERNVTGLVGATGLSQPNVSAHLACLKDCGLVTSERRGRHVYYSLAEREVAALLEQADALLGLVGTAIEACPHYGKDGP